MRKKIFGFETDQKEILLDLTELGFKTLAKEIFFKFCLKCLLDQGPGRDTLKVQRLGIRLG